MGNVRTHKKKFKRVYHTKDENEYERYPLELERMSSLCRGETEPIVCISVFCKASQKTLHMGFFPLLSLKYHRKRFSCIFPEEINTEGCSKHFLIICPRANGYKTISKTGDFAKIVVLMVTYFYYNYPSSRLSLNFTESCKTIFWFLKQ